MINSLAFSQSEAGGPPNEEQIIAFWKKKDYPKLESKNKENPWPQKYQWFAFYENGNVYSMMTDQDYKYTTSELAKIFAALPKSGTPTYKLKGQFILITNPQIENYQELWGVNLFAKDINEFVKKGNLLMTLDDGNGNVIYYRLLERID